MIEATQTVRDIALENPTSIRVFETLGIDYCCGGRMPLTEACSAKNLLVDAVIEALENTDSALESEIEDWNAQSLGSLAAHIVNAHHAYVRRELPRLTELAEKVVRRHGGTKPELPEIQLKLDELGDELLQHCAKEEMVLFPHIAKLERALADGTSKPHGCFGSVTTQSR